jgi:aerobic-type carbon monoxide dehydrogenase small subunit (CoxS/CutS family)
MAISLKINGASRTVAAEPDTPLLYVLRNDVELNGAKFGCGLAQCGACTVLIDGRTVDACLVLAVEADGASVLTVEGLAAPGGRLAPLQAAFLDKGAVQCGFCIPGQLVSAHALLAEHPHPTPAEIEEGIAGNLCRCGCYEQIFEAIEAVAEGSPIDTGLPGADAARDAGGSTAGGRTNAEGLDQ